MRCVYKVVSPPRYKPPRSAGRLTDGVATPTVAVWEKCGSGVAGEGARAGASWEP